MKHSSAHIYLLYGKFGVTNIDSLASKWTNEILEKDKFDGIADESCDVVPTFIGIHISVLVRSYVGAAYPANIPGKVQLHLFTDYCLTICV